VPALAAALREARAERDDALMRAAHAEEGNEAYRMSAQKRAVAVAEEREACARIAEMDPSDRECSEDGANCAVIARRIRARGSR
jgi:hypothetical protein